MAKIKDLNVFEKVLKLLDKIMNVCYNEYVR